MAKNPKISIIIPVYNSESFLVKCLDSVCAQIIKDIEIICVNDGSLDNSLNILREYAQKDGRIKIINQKNQGQSVARNNALKKAKGKYIGFIDSDDYIDNDFYQKLYEAAEKESADIVSGGIIRVENGHEESILSYAGKTFANKTNEIFKLLKLPKFCYVCNRLYRKDFILDNLLFFRVGVFYEDVIWSTVAASKAEKAVTVSDVSYYYVYNENSTVAQTEADSKKQNDMREAYRFYNRYISKNKIKADYRWENVATIRFLGLPLLKIKECPEVIKKYYFCAIPLVSVRIKKNY